MKEKILTHVLGATGFRSVVSRLAKWSGILCLNYHRIGRGDRDVYDRGLWSATPDEFDAQVRWLKSRFDVIGADDLPAALAARTGRYVLITFDDGYRDNYSTAFPILKGHGVRGTFFVTTGFIDTLRLSWWDEIAWMVRTSPRTAAHLPAWLPDPVSFDEPTREGAVRALLRAYKSIPTSSTGEYLQAVGEAAGTGRHDPPGAAELWMTWDMLREMRTAGMTVGGHTVSHPVLARMPREGQRAEIAECGRRLAAELGEPMRVFSYPVGGHSAFNDETRACLREAGVRFAFSYYGGIRTFDDWDDLDIRRVAVESYVTRDWFKAIVLLPRIFARAAPVAAPPAVTGDPP